MSVLVLDLVTAAYNRSAANDPGRLATDDELIGHLSRCLQRAWPLVARSRPDQFAAPTVALVLGGIPPSAQLPTDVIDVIDILDATGAPVWLVPLADRWRTWQLGPSVYRQGRQLISRNTGSDPRTGDTLSVTILDQPADVTALTDTLDTRWPRRQSQLLVDILAVYLSVKDTGRPDVEHQKLVAEMQVSAQAFAAEFGLSPEAVQWIHGPVERAAPK